MIVPTRASLSVLTLALATLLASSNVHAQNASEPLVSAASLQGIQRQLNALKAEVSSLQTSNTALQASDSNLKGQVGTLQARNTALQNQVKSLQTGNATLESQVGTLQSQLAIVRANPALALGPFVRVDPNPEAGVTGPNVIFQGVNVHIVSGSGTTNDNGNPLGLGNLLIGYDEDPASIGVGPLQFGDRGGSHNLVIGRYNRFTQAAYGGLVAGERNAIQNEGTSVTGGDQNAASGLLSSVSGGVINTAGGSFASVSGGANNTASGAQTSVIGGVKNTASGLDASVTGGNTNTASGTGATISGGFNNTDSGGFASISGGYNNTVSGNFSVILGGSNVIDAKIYSIAPQPPFPNYP